VQLQSAGSVGGEGGKDMTTILYFPKIIWGEVDEPGGQKPSLNRLHKRWSRGGIIVNCQRHDNWKWKFNNGKRWICYFTGYCVLVEAVPVELLF